jgi:hypothetical protein
VAQRCRGFLGRIEPLEQHAGAAREQLGALRRIAGQRGAAAQHVGELGPVRLRLIEPIERLPGAGVVGPRRHDGDVRLDRAVGVLELLLVDHRDLVERRARVLAALGDLGDALQRLDHLAPAADHAEQIRELLDHGDIGGREHAQALERVDRVVRTLELVGVDRREIAQQLRALGLGRGRPEPRIGTLLERRGELDPAALAAIQLLELRARRRIVGQHAEDAAQLCLGIARPLLLAADLRDLHQQIGGGVRGVGFLGHRLV